MRNVSLTYWLIGLIMAGVLSGCGPGLSAALNLGGGNSSTGTDSNPDPAPTPTPTPTLAISSITSGSTLHSGFILGTVSSATGVARVEVSFDGSGVWSAASGITSWKAAIPLVGSGTIWASESSHTVQVRVIAIDSSTWTTSSTITFIKGINNDYNGDGYADLAMGSPDSDYSGTDRGIAYVYYGSSTGVAATPDVTLTYPDSSNTANFGLSAHSAGDTNGDGYADLVIGAPGDNTNTGRMYVYHGSSSGLTNSANKSIAIAGMNTGAFFAETAMSAGDTNKDGYDDIVAGAWCANPGNCSGKALVFHGSSTGIGSTPDKTIAPFTSSNFKNFGRGISYAGDVNGDGYADILVGAHNTSNGSAYVFFGTSSGVNTTADVSISNPTATGSQFFGRNVAFLGDVNGDGYSDVAIGASRTANGGTQRGAFYVHLGSSTGTSSVANQTVNGTIDSGQLGLGISGVGDIDNDGYNDLIVTNNETTYLYHGTSTGISTSPTESYSGTASTGFGTYTSLRTDLNGDSYFDFVIGAYLDDTAGTDRGAAFVYYSSSSAASTSIGRTLLSPDSDNGAGFSRTKR